MIFTERSDSSCSTINLAEVAAMRLPLRLVVALALSLTAVCSTQAQDDAIEPGASANTEDQRMTFSEEAVEHPDDIVGRTVVDQQDREIGSVESVVVAKRNCAFFLVLSSDEFLGMGGDDLLVPTGAIENSGETLRLRSVDSVRAYLQQDYLVVKEDS